jgi:uncharacterized membrane protein YeaQ/YmgE (transglycosylase-associated protein family)
MNNTPDAITCFNLIPVPICRGTFRGLVTFWLLVICLAGWPALGADDPGLADKAKAAAQQTADSVQAAGNAVATDASALWQNIDAARLKNRTPDEIVAMAIMGVLVGALAGMMTPFKDTFFGKLGRLLVGLAGAALGGIVVRATHLDFGWGPVLIRYEELAASFVGAVLLILVLRFISAKSTRKSGGS